MSSKSDGSKFFSLIVVPHDGSAASDRALAYAIELARLSRSKLTILHIVQEIALPHSAFERPIQSKITGKLKTTHEYLKEIYHELKAEAIKMLESKKKESENAGVKAELKVVIGHPGDKIIQFIEEEGASLVVMGTTGLTGISKVRALGSVARAVSERAKCPVLLVH